MAPKIFKNFQFPKILINDSWAIDRYLTHTPACMAIQSSIISNSVIKLLLPSNFVLNTIYRERGDYYMI